MAVRDPTRSSACHPFRIRQVLIGRERLDGSVKRPIKYSGAGAAVWRWDCLHETEHVLGPMIGGTTSASDWRNHLADLVRDGDDIAFPASA
jgi:hypothetical protein